VTSAPHRDLRRCGAQVAAVVTALLVTGLLAIAPAAARLPAAPRPPAAPAAGATPVAIKITSVSAPSLGPRTQLTVTGTLRNTGRTPLTGLRLALRLEWQALLSRKDLSAWLAAQAPFEGTPGAVQEHQNLTLPLGPNQEQSFSITMRGDSAQLPTAANGFGPRGMAVDVQQGGRRVGIVRTFTVWSPTAAPPTSRLALLVPVTAGRTPLDPAGDGAVPPSTWADDGRLSTLLEATQDRGFTYALDPSLPAAALAAQSPSAPRLSARTAQAEGNAPSTSPAPATGSPQGTVTATATGPSTSPTPSTSPSPSFDPATAGAAKGWLDRLTRAVQGRQTVPLPFGDPDVAAIAHPVQRGRELLRPLDLAERTGTAAGRQALGASFGGGGLVWPAAGRADVSTAALAAQAPGRVLVLPSSGVTATGTATPPVHAVIPVSGGTAETLIADDTLSTTAGALGGTDATLATLRLLAETAALAATANATTPAAGAATPAASATAGATARATAGTTAGATAPVALATLPRDWDPDPATLQSSLSALHAAPWLSLTSVGSVRQVPAVAVDRSRLVRPAPTTANGLDQGHASVVVDLLAKLEDFAPALDGDGAARYVEPARRAGLELLGTAWIGRRQQLGTQLQPHTPTGEFADQVGGLLYGVQIQEGSSVNLLAWSGQLPVIVVNHLDVRLTVVLVLHPSNGLVRVEQLVTKTLLPGTSTIRVPLKALTTGHTQITARLLARDTAGADLVHVQPIDVNVHPEWQSRILTWVGAGLALLLVLGLVRGARRGRRARISPDAVPDPDDVGREAVPDRPVPGARPAPTGTGVAAVQGRPGHGSVALATRPDRLQVIAGTDTPGTGVPGAGVPGADGGGAADRSTSRLLSSSAVMATASLASRVLGMVRVAALAWAIGTATGADTFAIANTLPNSLFILIGGGVLNAVLVPQIVRAAKHGDGGQEYIDRLVTLAITVLGGATLVAVALAPVLVRVNATSTWTPAQFDLATAFALWCLPQIFFYGLYTIYGQILNARGSFGPFMWAPVVNNVVAITGCVVFVGLYGGGDKVATWWEGGPVAVLAGTATLGVVAQALVLVPALRGVGYRWRPRWGVRGVGLATAGRVAGWTFAAVLLGQLALIVVSRLSTAAAAAQGAHGRGRAVWDNAYLLFFLPHGLAVVSLVTALFTRMAAAAGAGRTDDVRADTSLAVRLTGVVTVISTVAVVVLGRDLTGAIFAGNGSEDTDSIALVTSAMALGLVAFSAGYLFQRVYYAFEDARTPFLIQTVVVAVWTAGSLLASVVLPPQWVTPAIGLAMSVSNVAGVALSAVLLRRRIGSLDGARVLRAHGRMAVAAVAAGLVAWAADAGTHAATDGVVSGAPRSVLALAVAGTLLVTCYAAGLRLLRVEEFDVVAGPVLRRLRRR